MTPLRVVAGVALIGVISVRATTETTASGACSTAPDAVQVAAPPKALLLESAQAEDRALLAAALIRPDRMSVWSLNPDCSIAELPAPPGRSSHRMPAITASGGAPCVAVYTKGREQVACLRQGRAWSLTPIPASATHYDVFALSSSGASINVLLTRTNGANRRPRLLRLHAGRWTEIGLPRSAGARTIVTLGSATPRSSVPLLGLVGPTHRRVYEHDRRRGWRLLGQSRLRGLQNQWSGPVRTKATVLFADAVQRSAAELGIQRTTRARRLQRVGRTSLSTPGFFAQGRLVSIGGTPWILWQEEDLSTPPTRANPQRAITVRVARLADNGRPAATRQVARITSFVPSELALVRLGTQNFAITTNTVGEPPTHTSIMLRRIP